MVGMFNMLCSFECVPVFDEPAVKQCEPTAPWHLWSGFRALLHSFMLTGSQKGMWHTLCHYVNCFSPELDKPAGRLLWSLGLFVCGCVFPPEEQADLCRARWPAWSPFKGGAQRVALCWHLLGSATWASTRPSRSSSSFCSLDRKTLDGFRGSWESWFSCTGRRARRGGGTRGAGCGGRTWLSGRTREDRLLNTCPGTFCCSQPCLPPTDTPHLASYITREALWTGLQSRLPLPWLLLTFPDDVRWC